jgi:hypothetical protein
MRENVRNRNLGRPCAIGESAPPVLLTGGIADVRAAPLLEVRNPAVPSDSAIPVVRSDVSTRDLTAAHFKPTTYGNDNVLVTSGHRCARRVTCSPRRTRRRRRNTDIVHGKVNFETER